MYGWEEGCWRGYRCQSFGGSRFDFGIFGFDALIRGELVLDFWKSIGPSGRMEMCLPSGADDVAREAEAELGIAHSPDVVSGVLRSFFCAGARVRDRSELGMNDLLSFFLLFLRFGVGVFDG